MIEKLLTLDTHFFLYLNSFNSEYIDQIMLFVSYNEIGMLCILLFLLFLVYKKYQKKVIPLFFLLLLSFGLSDSISTRVFKDNFERLRPCHEEGLKNQVHLAGENCWGGKFGFVSSHAANSFAISTFFILILKTFYSSIWLLYLYSFLVSYSRIYLARHYPLDIICGAMLGIAISILIIHFSKKKFPNLFLRQQKIDQS